MDNNRSNLPRLRNQPGAAIIGAVLISVMLFILIPFSQMLSFHKDVNKVIPIEWMESPPPPPLPPPPPPEEDDIEEDDPELEEEHKQLPLDIIETMINTELTYEGRFYIGVPDFELTGNIDDITFNIEDLDEVPTVSSSVHPVYPPQLRRLGIGGRIVITFIVDESGFVRLPRIESSTDYAFDKYALDAIKKWRFTPGIKKGKKVKTRMRLPINFSVH